jgi:predicted nucleic acid-binding Zn ribbon protein
VIPLEEALESTLRRLGLAEPMVMMTIARDWERIAGPRWADQASPIHLRDGILVVEAKDRRGVAFLRYAVGELHQRLAAEFGADTIKGVDLRPPARRTETPPQSGETSPGGVGELGKQPPFR